MAHKMTARLLELIERVDSNSAAGPVTSELFTVIGEGLLLMYMRPIEKRSHQWVTGLLGAMLVDHLSRDELTAREKLTLVSIVMSAVYNLRGQEDIETNIPEAQDVEGKAPESEGDDRWKAMLSKKPPEFLN